MGEAGDPRGGGARPRTMPSSMLEQQAAWTMEIGDLEGLEPWRKSRCVFARHRDQLWSLQD
jgi:hypothetical protein